MMRPLASPYRAEVDDLDDREWYALAAGFTDLNIYQVWQERSAGGRFSGTSRLVLRSGADVVAAAEVRLFRMPLTERGIAYVRWGPMWHRANRIAAPEDFRQFVRALRNEYVCRRHMVVRMNPRLFVEEDGEYLDILRDEGFAQAPGFQTERTLVMDVTPDLDDLRRGFEKKWRNCLSKAERAGLTVTSGSGLDLFDEFVALYRDMHARKQFVETADIQAHRRLQDTLPDALKMHIAIARVEGQPCAGAVVSALGDTALYLFGATNDVGMRTSASYAVQWQILEMLKARGVRTYDLHGINPESNPGTYHFKQGLAGKNGREATFGGHIQAFEPSIGSYSVLLVEQWRRNRRSVPGQQVARAPHSAVTPGAGA